MQSMSPHSWLIADAGHQVGFGFVRKERGGGGEGGDGSTLPLPVDANGIVNNKQQAAPLSTEYGL